MWLEIATTLVSAGLFTYAMARRMRDEGDDPTRHPIRRALLGIVRSMPGRRLKDLWRPSGLSRGSVEYHMRILERAARVHAVRSAGEVRFFPVEGGPRDPGSWSALLYGRNLELSELIASHPEWCQKDFADRLGIPRKEFRRYLRRLAAAELVLARRDKYRMRYVPTPRLREILPLVQRQLEQERLQAGGGGRP